MALRELETSTSLAAVMKRSCTRAIENHQHHKRLNRLQREPARGLRHKASSSPYSSSKNRAALFFCSPTPLPIGCLGPSPSSSMPQLLETTPSPVYLSLSIFPLSSSPSPSTRPLAPKHAGHAFRAGLRRNLPHAHPSVLRMGEYSRCEVLSAFSSSLTWRSAFISVWTWRSKMA
jgi:hypothetical protein